MANLPVYAPFAALAAPLLNLRNHLPPLRWLSEKLMGFSARRSLPVWRSRRFSAPGGSAGPIDGGEVVLWADTFNAAFEPETLHAAIEVLTAAGYRVHFVTAKDGSSRPLCCGRTYLSVGDVEGARREMLRSLEALAPFFDRGVPLVGLEPSCLLSFRDEVLALLPGEAASRAAGQALLFEEFIAREAKAGRFKLALAPIASKVLLHGHCHQKAFGAMGSVETTLRLIPDIRLETIDSSCCGMAGAFGYQAETYDVSRAMGELSLLPAVRAAGPDAIIVADGTSCRHQITDGAADAAPVHVARLLMGSLKAAEGQLT